MNSRWKKLKLWRDARDKLLHSEVVLKNNLILLYKNVLKLYF